MTAASPCRRAMASDAKRERILLSALRVFGRRGFHQATIDEVAREAGVGKGTIYLYVKNKEALLQEALEHVAGGHLHQVEEATRDVPDPLVQLRQVLEADARFLLSHRNVARALLGERTGIGYGARLRAALAEMRRRRKAVFVEIVRRAQAEGLIQPSVLPDRVAVAVMGMSNALLLDSVIERKAAEPRDLARFCLELLLGGVGRNG